MAYRSKLLKYAPDWRPVSTSWLDKPPAYIRDWLQETGSLTRRLKLLCNGNFNVSLQYQRWARPTLDERRTLDIRDSDFAVIREVLLRRNNDVLVVARTVIPRHMLVGRQRHLINLGTKPLGEVIFSEPGLKRSDMEIAVLKSASFQPNLVSAKDNNETIWGRRTCYIIHRKPILISEIFLPALFRYEGTSIPST